VAAVNVIKVLALFSITWKKLPLGHKTALLILSSYLYSVSLCICLWNGIKWEHADWADFLFTCVQRLLQPEGHVQGC